MTKQQLRDKLYRIPLRAIYQGMGLVSIADVIELFEQITGHDDDLQQTLDDMRSNLRSVQKARKRSSGSLA